MDNQLEAMANKAITEYNESHDELCREIEEALADRLNNSGLATIVKLWAGVGIEEHHLTDGSRLRNLTLAEWKKSGNQTHAHPIEGLIILPVTWFATQYKNVWARYQRRELAKFITEKGLKAPWEA